MVPAINMRKPAIDDEHFSADKQFYVAARPAVVQVAVSCRPELARTEISARGRASGPPDLLPIF